MTEERSNGYQDLYQAGWNAAIDAKATPSADVPLLTDQEMYDLYQDVMRGSFIGSLHYWRLGPAHKYAVAIEQAVRQKAGLK